MKLNGNFINLRPLQVRDAEITFGWRQSDRAQFLNQGASTVEVQERWILTRPKDEYNFIIELKDGHPVGTLSLINIDQKNRHTELGRFLIGDEEAAQGVANLKTLHGEGAGAQQTVALADLIAQIRA